MIMHAPILYIPHGGGPLPLLDHPGHKELVFFLKTFASRIRRPSAILVISAHWEETRPALTSAARPGMLYDYGGFPEEAYRLSYPAPGSPPYAESIRTLLADSGFAPTLDPNRDYDHGLFVPLMLMYPDARIPCLQLSLLKSLDPAEHLALGRALAPLRAENVLVIGSGMSYHNMGTFFSPGSQADNDKGEAFDNWLIRTVTDPGLSCKEREERLQNWQTAPHGRYCHPREEHLLPLHVCYGMAAARTPLAALVFNSKVMGKRVSAFLWHDAADQA